MESDLKEVFVVSTNILSSLGFTTEENIRSILNMKTGIALNNNPEIYPEPFQAAPFDRDKLQSLFEKYNLLSYNFAEASTILSILLCEGVPPNPLKGETPCHPREGGDPMNNRPLLLLSTTKGNIAELSPNLPPKSDVFLGYTAKKIADYFRINDFTVISNACVSGVSAIATATRLLQIGQYENVFVAGLDFLTDFTVSGFQSFKSVSPLPCRPYDRDRDGLSIGEAVGCIRLTNNPALVGNTHKIRVLGGATSNDANHISGPSRTGDGLSLAIENALQYSDAKHSDIDFINLHGTATVYNDEMESKALKLSSLSDTPAGSLKGYFGHTLGASGVIETIISIESLKRQTLFATLGFENLGTTEPMNISNAHKSARIHTFLKTASGFGGFNSAIVVSDTLNPRIKTRKGEVLYSEKYVRVEENRISFNGQTAFEAEKTFDFHDFIKSAYRNLNIDYPKFHKMDDLCKTAFICFEYLIKELPEFSGKNKQKTALVFGTETSSLDTDIKHRQTISTQDNYFPSPAIFVYTLPNTMLGEIAIRHKIQGETTCFVGEKTTEKDFKNYIELLTKTTDIESVIFGKIDFLGEKYSAWMSFAEINRN